MPERRTHVYLLRCGDHLKIGVAVNVGARMASLQVGNHMDLVEVGRRLFPSTDEAQSAERRLHERFAEKRRRGEWFAITDEEALAALMADGVPAKRRRVALREPEMPMPEFSAAMLQDQWALMGRFDPIAGRFD